MSEAKSLTCREVVELLSDYLDGALEDDLRRTVERHLAACEGCDRALAQVRETIRLTGMLREEHLTPEQEATFRDAFRGWDRRPGAEDRT